MKLDRRLIVRNLHDVLIMAGGAVLMALAYTLFLIPHAVVPGGVTGIAMILNHFWHTPVGLVTIVLNIPIFFLGIRTLGPIFGLKSVIGIVLSSLFIDFFTYIVPLHSATGNPVLAAAFGGILLGVGLGVVFRGHGSTGGTDIVGMVLNRYTNLSTGIAILVIDFVVISAAGLAFRSLELALYGYVALFLSSRVIDLVLEGLNYARAAIIITDHADAMKQAIFDKLGRGVTTWEGRGGYTGAQRPVLFCVLSLREVGDLRRLAKDVDPRAFVVITDVYEVLGKGFRPRPS